MTCEPLDVVAVPFPFVDRPTVKRRPALVVSSAAFNEAHAQSILAMITSARNDWPSDVPIQEWRRAGLQVPCKIRLKLFTLDDTLIIPQARQAVKAGWQGREERACAFAGGSLNRHAQRTRRSFATSGSGAPPYSSRFG